MPDAVSLAKAELRQIAPGAKGQQPTQINRGKWCTVQFNPETLKVSFANQLEKPPGAGEQRGTPAMQVIGTSTTKLSLTLWFDVGSPQPGDAVDDVRKLTQQVAYFIKPGDPQGKKGTRLPPMVRFLWGSFMFDGLMESMEENLEFFSPDGKPLRASVAISLTQQDFQFSFNPDASDSGGPTPGTRPLSQAPAGSSVQQLADAAGAGSNWQSIAAANGIENPRALAAGALLDLSLRAGVSAGLSAGADISAGLNLQVDAGVSVGF